MKNFILILLIFLSTQIHAQESKLQAEAAVIAQREDKLILLLTSDNLRNLPADIDAKPFRSRGFSFSLMNEMMNKSGTAGIGGGLGFMSQNFHTDGFIIDTTAQGTFSSFDKITDDFSVNKLSLNFLTATLELRLRSNENKSGNRFKLSAGVTAALLLQSHTKFENKYGKFKTYGIEHLNKFQYGISGRIGYSNYCLSAYYSLVDVFKKNQGVKVAPFSAGIGLTF